MNKHYIAGINSINSALEKNLKITQLWVDQQKDSKRINQILSTAQSRHIAIHQVDKMTLDLLAIGSKHQGVIAELNEASHNKPTLESLLQQPSPLILILDGIQDPHNLGACLRSAAAANVDAVILPKNRSAGLTPTVSKVACGGAEMLPIFIETNLSRLLEKIKKKGLWTVALTGHTEETIYQTDFQQASVIILGNEEKGISKNLLKQVDFTAKIPMPGNLESLNVSVATGIVLFEALRQRGGHSQ